MGVVLEVMEFQAKEIHRIPFQMRGRSFSPEEVPLILEAMEGLAGSLEVMEQATVVMTVLVMEDPEDVEEAMVQEEAMEAQEGILREALSTST